MSGERVSVDKDALEALIEAYQAERHQVDSEFCVGQAEHEASDATADRIIAALNVR